MTRALLALALCLPAAARAAAPADGRPTAVAEAELRAPDAVLVEIEGFTSPEGDIPCRGKSFSNAWHYKFYVKSTGEWLIVNACGDNFINAAKHFPYRKSDEAEKALPRSIAAPAAVLKKLKDDGLFSPEPNRFSRDIQMLARLLPEKDGRPAGCYWTVTQGKAKFIADCDAAQAWKVSAGSGKPGAAGGTLKAVVRGKDTAGRYANLAVDYMRKKNPDSQLIYVETLADKTGSTKCVDPRDGWVFVFRSRMGVGTFGGCRNKTSVENVVFDGSKSAHLEDMDPIVLPFKDSDFALSQVPKDCLATHPTFSMKLANYKPGHSPASGPSQVWTIHCGAKKYYVDATTGQPMPVDVKTK